MYKLKSVELSKHSQYNEAWVQQQIAEDPSILDLGDLTLKDRERVQISNGRLDLLLQDPDTLKRYEVELQLGSLDESHLIRTIEYWDIERKRYPQYEHCAVIVAEDITSRFLNVVQLFNGHIPLIAVKMTAYEVEGQIALTFTKIVDEIQYGLVDEDEEVAEQTDRSYWEKKSTPKSLKLVDQYLQFIQEVDPNFTLNYNKHYIGLQKYQTSLNLIYFKVGKSAIIVHIKVDRNSETTEKLEELDLEIMSNNRNKNQYRIKISGKENDEQIAYMKLLIAKAIEN